MCRLLDEDKDGKVTLGELKKLLGKLKKVEEALSHTETRFSMISGCSGTKVNALMPSCCEENPNEGEQELSTPTNDKKGKKAKKHK